MFLLQAWTKKLLWECISSYNVGVDEKIKFMLWTNFQGCIPSITRGHAVIKISNMDQ
jgi:hypothetical protein